MATMGVKGLIDDVVRHSVRPSVTNIDGSLVIGRGCRCQSWGRLSARPTGWYTCFPT